MTLEISLKAKKVNPGVFIETGIQVINYKGVLKANNSP